MASSTRFDPVSGSPEGSALPASYSNGQRGSFSAGSLDRSGSFREGSDGRTANTGPTLFRGDVSLYADMPPVAQYLNLDLISLAEPKHIRPEELKKVLGASSMANEDGSFGAVLHAKPLPQVVLGELKRFRSSIVESSARAKERTKLFNESITKLDKYRLALLSRKRPRNDGLPNEKSSSLHPGDRSAQGTSFKMGPQNHQLLGSDLMSPRSDDRSKNIIPNRRIRTSLVEVRQAEGRNNSLSRPSAFVEKDRELLRTTNGMPAQAEEKTRGLTPGGDGWEKKMKRKRSIGLAVSRALDADQDHKRSMQQRLSNENRSRLNDVHGFRAGSASAIGGVNKLDIATQPSGLNVRPIPRADQDSISADRKDRIIGPDKEKTIVKAISKQNVREGNQVGNPTSVAKLKASRAPRTGPGALFNSSTNFSRTGGTPEGWEQSPSLNKAQGVGGLNNRKRPLSTRSSSPVTQWGGQRPQKMPRVARRTNLVPPVPNRDEAQLTIDGFPNSDTGARLISVDANGSGHPKRAPNISQHFKLKVENILSPAGFSESEDSGAVDKSKDKGRNGGEVEDRAVSSIQKASLVLTSKKNKVVTKEELGDGVRRQGRSGRGLALSRSCLPLSREKTDNASNPKHRSTRPVPDKIESKSGRPPTKKFSDRKASARPGNIANISSDFNGEADDDREELVAAATFARKASYNACSSPFWKQIEPIFAFVTPDAIACLQEQRRFAEELESSLCLRTGTDQNNKDQSFLDRFTTFPGIDCEEKQPLQSNEAILNELGMTERSVDEPQIVDAGKIETNSWFEKIIPLSQRLLAALIVEDEVNEANQIASAEKDNYLHPSDCSPFGASSHIPNECRGADRKKFEIESEVELNNHRCHSHDNFSCDGAAMSNGFRSPKTHNLTYKNQELVQQDGFTPHSEVGEQHKANGLQPIQTDVSGITLVDCCYQQMSLDDRILLELQSIGLFPETVPGLSQGEDDEITKDLSKLKKDLFHQVKKKKIQLYKLEKAVLRSRELERRDLEHLALNKLVDIAYKKHMTSRGGNASHKSGGSKISKQVAVPFVKRTLARCKKYEETGTSCFGEHLFEGGFMSTPPCSSDTKCTDGTKVDLTLKPCLEAPSSQHDSKTTGVLASGLASNSIEHSGLHSLNKDLSGASQHAGHSSDQSFGKDEPWPNRGKKRELSLDAVVSNVARGTTNLGGSLLGGAKGKRSERDRDPNREGMIRNSVTKTGRPTIGSVRGERKTKTKPRQKTAQLSNSVNGLLGRPSELPSPMLNSMKESSEPSVSQSTKVQEVLPKPSVVAQDPLDPEGAIDLTHLPLPGMEEFGVGDDLVDQSQDLGNWLSCPDDVLQDHDNDFDGLLVPMDDLSEVV